MRLRGTAAAAAAAAFCRPELVEHSLCAAGCLGASALEFLRDRRQRTVRRAEVEGGGCGIVRLRSAPQHVEDEAFGLVCHRKVRIIGDRRVAAGHRHLEGSAVMVSLRRGDVTRGISPLEERCTEIVVRIGVGRFHSNGRLQRLDSLRLAAHLAEGEALVVQRVEKAWVELQCAVVRRQRVLQPPEPLQRQPAVNPRVGATAARAGGHRRIKARQCLLQAVLVELRGPGRVQLVLRRPALLHDRRQASGSLLGLGAGLLPPTAGEGREAKHEQQRQEPAPRDHRVARASESQSPRPARGPSLCALCFPFAGDVM